jgi:hypothetical protein
VLSIYPILEYRRSASHRLFLLHQARQLVGTTLNSLPERETEQLVVALAIELTKIRNDLAQFPITYYFHERDRLSAFPSALPLALDIALHASEREHGTPIRIAGTILQHAIHDFLCLIGKWFLNMPDENDDRKLMHAFAQDHFFQELHSA